MRGELLVDDTAAPVRKEFDGAEINERLEALARVSRAALVSPRSAVARRSAAGISCRVRRAEALRFPDSERSELARVAGGLRPALRLPGGGLGGAAPSLLCRLEAARVERAPELVVPRADGIERETGSREYDLPEDVARGAGERGIPACVRRACAPRWTLAARLLRLEVDRVPDDRALLPDAP